MDLRRELAALSWSGDIEDLGFTSQSIRLDLRRSGTDGGSRPDPAWHLRRPKPAYARRRVGWSTRAACSLATACGL
jgi:hypothetical protein